VGVTSAVGADGAVERVEPDQKRKFFFQSETARWLKEPRDDVPSSPAGAPLRTGSYWRGRRDSPPATAHNPARSLRESDDIGYRRWIRRPRSIRRAEASGSSETKGRTPRKRGRTRRGRSIDAPRPFAIPSGPCAALAIGSRYESAESALVRRRPVHARVPEDGEPRPSRRSFRIW